MIKWLYEWVLAFAYKKVMGISLLKAHRFVRCDFLTQEKISKDLGLNEEKSGRE